MGGWILLAAIVLVLGAMIFLALRELMLWYWKIDRTVQLLEEIRDLLADTRDRNNPVRATASAATPEQPEISVFSWARRTFSKDSPDKA